MVLTQRGLLPMSQALRIAFAGTPAFAAQALQAIKDAGFSVVFVLTQPDQKSGRGLAWTASPVKELARAWNLPLLQPRKLTLAEEQREFREIWDATQPDILVVAAFGQILPQAILDISHMGCINIHASLLPRWRGAAPIARAIEAGDNVTGVTIMRMDAGLDTGPMLRTVEAPITQTDTTESLTNKLAKLGAQEIVHALNDDLILSGTPQPQTGVTYARKIDKAEARINWKESAILLARRIRAFDPEPGVSARINNTDLKLWAAAVEARTGEPGSILEVGDAGLVCACGSGGALRITHLQRAGGKRLPAGAFLAGFRIMKGGRFEV